MSSTTVHPGPSRPIVPADVTPSVRSGYRDLVSTLRRQIETGQLVPGDKLPSFAEMRRQGLGQATVERAYVRLEQDGLISREARRGIFVASQGKELTGRIGFVGTAFVGRTHSSYAAHLVDGIEAVAQREGLRVVLLKENAPLSPGVVDGVLVNSSDDDVRQYLRQGIPAVSLLNNVAGVPSVVADDFHGARLGIRRLTELGHRRIAALLQASVPSIHIRLAGYHNGLLEAGITPQESWVRDPGYMSNPGGYRAWGFESMRAWLRDEWHELSCSALFVQNDMTALGVLDALREAGIRVPEDLTVLSFDGTEVCEYCWPTLAAIQIPLEKIASTGMELLLRIVGGERIEPSVTMLAATWKDGNSVAPPKQFPTGSTAKIAQFVPEVSYKES